MLSFSLEERCRGKYAMPAVIHRTFGADTPFSRSVFEPERKRRSMQQLRWMMPARRLVCLSTWFNR
jgi:hypothetical protein